MVFTERVVAVRRKRTVSAVNRGIRSDKRIHFGRLAMRGAFLLEIESFEVELEGRGHQGGDSDTEVTFW